MGTFNNGESGLSVRTKINDSITAQEANTTKLSGIENGAEVNPTAGEIKTAYESNADTNAFTDAEQSKLSGIEAGAQVNVIAARYFAILDTEGGVSATESYNDYGATITWTNPSTGVYRATMTGGAYFSTTLTRVSAQGNSVGIISVEVTSTTVIDVTAYDSEGSAIDGLFTALQVEIINYT